jgi:signal transduction histidine kinase
VLLLKTLRSSTFKFALISIAVFGTLVVGLFSYVYRSATSFVLDGSDRAIDAELATLLETHGSTNHDALVAIIRQHMVDYRFTGGVYLFTDRLYVPVVGNIEAWPSALKDADRGDATNANALKSDPPGGAFQLRARTATLPDGFHLLVGRDVDDLFQFLHQIDAALAIGVALIFVIAAVASISVTRRTVGRIESINATSRAIMETGLGQRIPLRGTQDEWDQLAQNLNSMLERIESLMAEVKQVSDNVAHDLRTPLTRVRGRLEKASAVIRDPDFDRALIHETIADLDDVLRIFSSLTRISQIETADRTAAFRVIDLGDVAAQVAELFDAAAEEKEMHLDLVSKKPVFVTADRDLLFEALSNLVDNAIKHGREKGRVTIGFEQKEPYGSVFVSDDGPGIPLGEFQHVFKRFYRLERSRGTPGNGLGLSLMAAVAHVHGAHIEMFDNAPGLKVELRFALALETREEPRHTLEAGTGP